MKTTEYAVSRIFQVLTGLNAVDIPVYTFTKPTKANPPYIVINSLPISAGVLQRQRVNVNIYAADKESGTPDMETLQRYTAEIMALTYEINETGLLIDFESQEYIREYPAGMHYSNIRLFIKVIN
jgi:hypothetical protein